MKQFSFIIPVYNCKESISICVKTIEELKKYSQVSYEIILVDDGSTDGSTETCDNLADKANINALHQINKGVSAARNAGLMSSSGEYVIFVDSDDIIDAQKLAPLLETVVKNPQIDMAVYGILFEYFAGKHMSRTEAMLPPFSGIHSRETCIQSINELYETNCLSAVWNKIIRKSLAVQIKFMEDMILYEDLEYSVRLLGVCERILFYQETVYHYRQVEGGHAGMRLKKIHNLEGLIDRIDHAFKTVGADDQKIILSIYKFLTVQKIYVSNKEETALICQNYKAWMDTHGMNPYAEEDGMCMLVYNQNISALLKCKRKKEIRNHIVYLLKITGVYQIIRKML